MSGIWQFSSINSLVKPKFQFSLNEANTSLEKISLDSSDLYFKRDDENPNQSFKDRSLAFQLSTHFSKGVTSFVISSSGNAAVSAAAYSNLMGVSLNIFVSDKISEQKLLRIEKHTSSLVKIHKSKRAKSDTIKFATENDVTNLRGSQDDNAIIGFQTIAYELVDQLPKIDAVFIPCSSGTSTIGVANGFRELGKNVAIHICQTERIHPIAKEFDEHFHTSATSLADAITDRVAHRKDDVINVLESTNGDGWVLSDMDIDSAKKMLNNKNINNISYNSLLSVAGYLKAKNNNYDYNYPVALISGL